MVRAVELNTLGSTRNLQRLRPAVAHAVLQCAGESAPRLDEDLYQYRCLS